MAMQNVFELLLFIPDYNILYMALNNSVKVLIISLQRRKVGNTRIPLGSNFCSKLYPKLYTFEAQKTMHLLKPIKALRKFFRNFANVTKIEILLVFENC